MRIGDLKPARGAVKKRKRLGTGPGSGHGGTSTRGHKGLKARSGGRVPPWFEGGQMPLQRRVPKGGFTNPFRRVSHVVNLKDVLQRFEPGVEVTIAALIEKRMVRGRNLPVKLLGTGEVSQVLTIKVNAVSEGARTKIEAAGGRVELIPFKRGERGSR
jgi:large subunit ribosomal protein L15